MSTAQIRRADASEFDEVDRIIHDAYAHDYGISDHVDPMRHARDRAEHFDVWVMLDETGGILGSVTTRRAGGRSLQEDAADDELDLRLLGVSPAARRRGVASALMRFVIEEAGRQGFRGVLLKTAPNMVGAHRLYESLGFARAAERDGLWIDGQKVFDLLTYTYRLDRAGEERPAPSVAVR